MWYSLSLSDLNRKFSRLCTKKCLTCRSWNGIAQIITRNLGLLGEAAGDWSKDVDARLQHAISFGKKCGFVADGDNVICVTGWRQGAGASNTVRIVQVK